MILGHPCAWRRAAVTLFIFSELISLHLKIWSSSDLVSIFEAESTPRRDVFIIISRCVGGSIGSPGRGTSEWIKRWPTSTRCYICKCASLKVPESLTLCYRMMSVFKGYTHAPTFPMMFKSASSRRARRLMPTFAGLLRSVSTLRSASCASLCLKKQPTKSTQPMLVPLRSPVLQDWSAWPDFLPSLNKQTLTNHRLIFFSRHTLAPENEKWPWTKEWLQSKENTIVSYHGTLVYKRVVRYRPK